MTLVRHITIDCDHTEPDGTECTASGHCAAWLYGPAHQLRAYLREKGWARRNGRDLCPDHAAATTAHTA